MTLSQAFGSIEDVGAANFAQKVLGAKGPVVVEFFDPGCPHCQRSAPTVARAAASLSGKVQFYKADVWNEAGLRAKFGVQGWPTFVLFSGGKEVSRVGGEQTNVAAFVNAVKGAYRI